MHLHFQQVRQQAGHALRDLAPLLLLLLLGAVLRIPGLFWGIPDASHPYWSYHPDEALPIRWGFWLQQGQYVPNHFQYGGTFHYTILNTYRYYAERFGEWLQGINVLANTLMVGRSVVAACSLLTLAIIYATGRRLYDRSTAVLATAFLAVAPAHALLTRSVRPDEMSTLLVSIQLYGAAALLSSNRDNHRRALLALGLLAGVETALRFPVAVFAAAPIVAYAMGKARRSGATGPAMIDYLKAAMLTAVAAVCGYIITSPYSLFHPDVLMDGLQIQREMLKGLCLDAVDRGPGLILHGWTDLRDGLGWPLYALALCGVLLAALRRNRSDLLLLVALLPYFTLLTLSSWIVVRYTMPLAPVLSLLAAAFVVSISRQGAVGRRLVAIVAVSAIAWTFIAVFAFANMMTTRDPRDVASSWIADHAAAGTAVTDVQLYLGDVFSNPPIPPDHPASHLLLRPDASIDTLVNKPADSLLVINESVYDNIDRLGARHPYASAVALGRLLGDQRFHKLAEIRRPVQWLGLNFDHWFTSQDYLIMNPGIRIYSFHPTTAVP